MDIEMECVGFLPGWLSADQFSMRRLVDTGAASRLSMLNYAFATVRPQYSDRPVGSDNPILCQSLNAWQDYQRPVPAIESVSGENDSPSRVLGNFGQLHQLKTFFPDLKLTISIGGWTDSKWFSPAASTERGRQTLAASAIDQFLRGRLPGVEDSPFPIFDGIDVDWEFPGFPGAEGNFYSPVDSENFSLLLHEFRRQMDRLSDELGRRLWLTCDLAAGIPQLEVLRLDEVASAVDWVNIMTYDFHGAWEPQGPANFHANLFSGEGSNPGTTSVDDAIQTLKQRGLSAGQIVMGVPFYGHGWQGVAAGSRFGLYQEARAPLAPEAGFGPAWNQIRRAGAPLHRDPATGGVWTYDADDQIFWCLDDPWSLYMKAIYARAHRLRGMMIWSLDADDAQGSLIHAMHQGWHLRPLVEHLHV